MLMDGLREGRRWSDSSSGPFFFVCPTGLPTELFVIHPCEFMGGCIHGIYCRCVAVDSITVLSTCTCRSTSR